MEIISPWALYWVLQIDSIKTLFLVVGFGLVIPIAGMSVVACEDVFDMEDPSAKEVRKWFARLAALGFFLIAANAFMPSTKNVAAIVVIPAIANNATVQNEASEIYQLAKQAMRNAVDAKPEPKPEDSKPD